MSPAMSWGSAVFGAAAQRTLQQPIAEPFTGGAGRQEQQEQPATAAERRMGSESIATDC